MGGGAKAPLNVAIVGAGIGGLTAAIELRQKGHFVTLYEQSRFANEYGAAIHLAPNAMGLLQRLGINLADDGGVPTEIICEGDRDANITKTIPIGKFGHMWQNGWVFCHRRTLHDRLKKEALKEDGPGKAVRLLTSSRVASVDPQGSIELVNGEKYHADVVIGADGVHSTVRRIMFPGLRAGSSGKNAYRFLLKKEDLAVAEPETYELVKADGTLTSYYDLDRRIVIFPADHNEWLNLVCMHPEHLSDGSGEEWSRTGDKSKMLQIYQDFSPKLKAILSQAPDDSLKVWKLLDLNPPLQSWTQGKLCLLGDAAHPFLPYNGQGGACAIEDAASIGVMLPLGTTIEQVPERLKLYETARMQRANELQKYSREAGKDLKPDAMDMVGNTMAKLTTFAYGHDEFHSSTQVFREYQYSKAPDGLTWRSPIGFGPTPGARQTPSYDILETNQTPYRTVAVRMKTSRTLLQNLLPRRDILSFNSAATVAEVTWKYQANEQVGWLGGRPYSHFSLYLHDVKCQKSSSEALVGDYLAIMLEDQADPVITGRDELGFPKLFCDLNATSITDDQESQVATQIKASWQGHTFATLNVLDVKAKDLSNGVEDKPAAKGGWKTPPPFAGTLIHRYVPAVGKKNESDADYMACVPPLSDDEKPTRDRVWTGKTASIKLDSGDWSKLPLLHNIVARLQELPNLGIVETTITEGKGVSNHRNIYKVL